jgi:hypothetical protein
MRTRSCKYSLVASLSLTLLGGCGDSGVLEPSRPGGPSLTTRQQCLFQNIPDEDCENYFVAPYDVVHDEAEAELTNNTDSFTPYSGAQTVCPDMYWGGGGGRVRDPKTGYYYTFTAQGTFIMSAMESTPFLLSNQAVYYFPDPGYGGWTARNESNPGGVSASVWVDKGRGSCVMLNPRLVSVNYFLFWGVRVKDPWLRNASYDPSGGGSFGGTGGGTCSTVYIYIEKDNGSGWQVVWEGYATVCG